MDSELTWTDHMDEMVRGFFTIGCLSGAEWGTSLPLLNISVTLIWSVLEMWLKFKNSKNWTSVQVRLRSKGKILKALQVHSCLFQQGANHIHLCFNTNGKEKRWTDKQNRLRVKAS